MEASATAAGADAERESIGLNIVLPHEQAPNPCVTPYLSFQFHYFALRKMHFLIRARAVAVFPGGFGTFDEMFELLTLIQTGKMKPIPVLLFGKEFWTRVIDFGALAREGVVSPEDLKADQLVRDGRGSLGVHLQLLQDRRRWRGDLTVARRAERREWSQCSQCLRAWRRESSGSSRRLPRNACTSGSPGKHALAVQDPLREAGRRGSVASERAGRCERGAIGVGANKPATPS